MSWPGDATIRTSLSSGGCPDRGRRGKGGHLATFLRWRAKMAIVFVLLAASRIVQVRRLPPYCAFGSADGVEDCLAINLLYSVNFTFDIGIDARGVVKLTDERPADPAMNHSPLPARFGPRWYCQR